MNDWADSLLKIKTLEKQLLEALLKRKNNQAHLIVCSLVDIAQELEDIISTLDV